MTRGIYTKGRLSILSECLGRLTDFCINFLSDLRLVFGKLISGLEIHPESGALSEIAGEREGCFSGQVALAVQDLGNPARGNAELKSKFVGGKATYRHFAFENASWVNWFHKVGGLLIEGV